MAENTQTDEKPRDIKILDNLIEKLYNEIEKQNILEVKLGDLLKMIEVRRKLLPGGKDQKEFWKMIDNIRRESIKKPKVKSKRKTGSKKKTKE